MADFCAPLSLLACRFFCITCPSSLVLPSPEHMSTHNLGCGYSSVFCPHCKSDSQTVSCTRLYRAKCGCYRGNFYPSETATRLPLNCQAFAVRNKICPSVCFLQSPKIGNYLEKQMATKGIRNMIWEGPEDIFSSLSQKTG